MSVNPEDWDVDFAFPDFNLALFEWERSWCRNCIVTFPSKKIWFVFKNFNADHAWRQEWTGRNSRGFSKKLTSESFDNDNKLTLKSFFGFCRFFFNKDQRRKDGNDFEKDTVPGSRILLQRYIKELKLTALLVLTKFTRGEKLLPIHSLKWNPNDVLTTGKAIS